MRTVQILAFPLLGSPEITKVPATLGTMQEIVGGLVEIFEVELGGKTYQVVTLEDAEYLGKSMNRKVGGRMLYGTFVVTKYGGTGFASILNKEAMKVWELIDQENQ